MADTHLICFNINCYRRFETARGLSRHLAHQPACKFAAEQAVPLARLDMTPPPPPLPPPNLSNLNWYGTQRNRLNPSMSSTAPVITPFSTCAIAADNTEVVDVDFPDAPSTDDENDYDEPHEEEDEGIDDDYDTDHLRQEEEAVFTARMERTIANEEQAIALARFNPEYSCVSKLLVILEKMNAPDYALEQVLGWASNANNAGFSFAPAAATRQANLNWMYKLMENSKQMLPQVVSIPLEDHVVPQDIVFFTS